MRNPCRYLVTLGLLLLTVGIAACLISIVRPATMALAAPALSDSAVPDNCGPGWAVVPSANVSDASNVLAGVSALSSTEIWAVGGYMTTTSITQTLTQRWNGSAWSIVPSPNVGTSDNVLQAVSARASNDVWAVGYYHTSSTSAYQTLILHWNGTAWTQTLSPSPGSVENYLYGVASVSATDAWAVGYYSNSANIYQPLLERWNGTTWNQVSGPPFSFGGLRGVSVIAANDIWAVGASIDLSLNFVPYALHWNGSSWSNNSPSNQPGCVLAAVAGVASNNVWAVGGCDDGTRFTTFAVRWNGSSWTVAATPSPGSGDNLLGGLAVVSATDIWAVGGYDTGAEVLTLAVHWDGTSWTQGKSANPSPTNNGLVAATATGGSLWAVGSYDGETLPQTLVEQYGTIPCVTTTPTVATTGTVTSIPTSTSLPSSTTTATLPASTLTPTPLVTIVASSTPLITVLATSTNTAIVPTATRTSAPASSTVTNTPAAATATATVCTVSFTDVPPDSTFYTFIRCLACRGIISGYSDGTFKPNNDVTRSQIAKIVSNAAGFDEDPGPQIYEDVPADNTFYQWINRLSMRGHMGGYPCGTVDAEPCIGPDNRPYFRPFSNATRGQLAKIVANAAGIGGTPTGQFFTDVAQDHPFYTWIMRLAELGVMGGYDCGGPGEPCDSENRPYFRPFNNVTRGQASKIVANTFFPGCETPSR